MTEQDKKLLQQFPVYDGKPEHFIGSRKYWEYVFESETNRDPELHTAFGELHHRIVNEVIQFCKEHNISIDEFYIMANGVDGSIPFGEWCSCTDSSMTMYVYENGKCDRDKPFLYEI